jgi:hypothetical protein
MKRIILFSLFCILAAISCKKSSSPSSDASFITATMDGKGKTFNVHPMAIRSLAGAVTSIDIFGSASAAPSQESLGIAINNSPGGKPIAAGTYSETSSVDYIVAGVYNEGSSSIVYGTGLYPNPANPFHVTISSIDNSTVKGTFSGDFYYINTITGVTQTVKRSFTNGQFSVKF